MGVSKDCVVLRMPFADRGQLTMQACWYVVFGEERLSPKRIFVFANFPQIPNVGILNPTYGLKFREKHYNSWI